MPSAANPRRFWEKTAARLASRVNFAAWLDGFAPGAFAAASVVAVTLYALRRARSPGHWGLAVGALALVTAALFAWWRARRRFFTQTDARVLLEYKLGLDAALSAATAGIAPWPPARILPRVVRWHAPDTLGWLAGGIAMVVASLVLPIPVHPELGVNLVEPPPALAETQALLREAAKLTTVDPVALATYAERAQELAAKTPAGQYTHSSLEAADALQAQVAKALQDLARSFEQASNSLAPLAQPGNTLSDAQRGALANNLATALSSMHEGGLSANQDMLKQLGDLTSAGALSQLSPAQAAQLAQQMTSAQKGLQGIPGAKRNGQLTMGPGMPGSGFGQSGNGPGQSGQHGLTPNNGFGNGGPGGGGGTSPLTFGDPTKAGDGKAQGITSGDLSRATLGDKLETTRGGAHDVDPSKSVGPMSAGAVTGPAEGGEAVSMDHLTPAERAVVKDFFK